MDPRGESKVLWMKLITAKYNVEGNRLRLGPMTRLNLSI